MRGVGCHAHRAPARGERVVRRDERREQRNYDEEQDEAEPDHRALAVHEAPQRALGRRELPFVRKCVGGKHGGHAQPLIRGLTRKYAMSARRLRTMYAVAVNSTTPCTTW